MTPVEVNKLQVRRHFDAHAEDYDRYAQVQKRVVQRLAGLCSGALAARGMMLDIGTGTGMLARELRRLAPGRPLVVSDLAHGMTRHARAGLGGITGVDADATALPFCAGCFDFVASSSVYQWVEDLPRAFAEVSRVLVPRGWFAFALFGERSLFELRDCHRRALSDCGFMRRSHAQEFPTIGQVDGALQVSGFRIESLFREEEVDLHEDVPQLLRALKKIGAGNASRNRPAGLAPRRVMQRMIEIYRLDYGRGEGIPSTYEVVYGLARKN